MYFVQVHSLTRLRQDILQRIWGNNEKKQTKQKHTKKTKQKRIIAVTVILNQFPTSYKIDYHSYHLQGFIFHMRLVLFLFLNVWYLPILIKLIKC